MIDGAHPEVDALAKAVGALARQVVHDVNNARSLIANYAEFALDALPADSPARADIEAIARAGSAYAGIVERLERLAWPDTLVSEAVDAATWLAAATTVAIEGRERTSTVLVPADLGERAVALLVEACDATAVTLEQGRVTVSGRPRAEPIHRLGEWFAQAAFAAAGGSVEIREGGYVVTLRGGESTTPPSVVLVEDQPALRLLAERILRQRGYAVTATADIAQARATVLGLAQDPAVPLVVVTDVELPGGSGLDLLAELKRLRPDVRMAAMTAHDRPAGVDPAIGWITKPFTASDLVGAVERALSAPAG